MDSPHSRSLLDRYVVTQWNYKYCHSRNLLAQFDVKCPENPHALNLLLGQSGLYPPPSLRFLMNLGLGYDFSAHYWVRRTRSSEERICRGWDNLADFLYGYDTDGLTLQSQAD